MRRAGLPGHRNGHSLREQRGCGRFRLPAVQDGRHPFVGAEGVAYPEAVAAQASLESGHGKSELTQKYNNPLGLKVNRPSEIEQGQKAVQMETKEFVEGKEGVYKEPFRVFNSLKDAFVGYKEKVAHPRYESIRQAKNADEYLVAIQDSGYATDPKYAEKTINIMKRYAGLLYKYQYKGNL